MYAYRLTDWEQAPRLLETETPVPQAGQVLVRVADNGLCQSDLHLSHMPQELCAALGWNMPFTLGHEVGGWIESWGAGISGLEKGEPVALVSPQSCGACLECTSGYDNICTRGGAGRGYELDGGLAEFVLLDSVRPLIKLRNLDPFSAGPLTDAGSTSYHAVNRVRGKLTAGASALLIGAGGLDSFALQYLRLLGKAEILVADMNAGARRRAMQLGAHACIDSRRLDLQEEVRKLTSGRGGAGFRRHGSDYRRGNCLPGPAWQFRVDRRGEWWPRRPPVCCTGGESGGHPCLSGADCGGYQCGHGIGRTG